MTNRRNLEIIVLVVFCVAPFVNAQSPTHLAGAVVGDAQRGNDGAASNRDVPVPLPEDSLGLSCTNDGECPNESVCLGGVCYVPKNRFVSFVPVTTGLPVAFQVTSANCPDMIRWVGGPFECSCCSTEAWAARLEETPLYSDTWPDVLHVGDEETHPLAGYEIRATVDGILFSDPLLLPTTRVYGDIVGRFVDGAWQPPDGLMNVDDAHALGHAFKGFASAPCAIWTALGDAVPSGCSCHDIFVVWMTFTNRNYGWPTSCECGSATDCADDAFCNGIEACGSGDVSVCAPGADPCPGQLCDDEMDACEPCQIDGDCDDGLFCNGPESCVAGVCTRAAYPCGDQGCNELMDVCGPGSGPTMSLIPISASGGNPVFDDNRVSLDQGGHQVEFEIRLSDWDVDQNGDPVVDAYQATVDAAGYLGANAAPPFPGVDLIPVGYPDTPEDGAYLDGDRPDFVFFTLVPLTGVYRATLDYAWGSSPIGDPKADDGQTYYLGTLILEVPFDAVGTYTITLNPDDSLTFLNADDGGRIPGLTTVPGLITLPTDCNNNGVPDAQDITSGTSEDCNDNAWPDECDLAGGISTDCNANLVPDECEPDEDCNSNGVQDICDIAGGTSADCSGNGIPDECEPDCNGNGVADSCDIFEGTSDDCQPNGVPDECDLAGGTSHDYDENGTPDDCERMNRYVLFPPDNPGPPIAYQVEMSQSLYFPDSRGVLGWVGEPVFEDYYEPGAWVARVVHTPFYTDSWPSVVHLGDCAIIPVATYLIRGTVDGETFTDPFEVSTIAQPAPKYWADCVGAFDGTKWTGANRVVNMDDVMAGIQKFSMEPTAPHITSLDIGNEVPNAILNMTDIQMLVRGFKGEPYPFSDPAACGR